MEKYADVSRSETIEWRSQQVLVLSMMTYNITSGWMI